MPSCAHQWSPITRACRKCGVSRRQHEHTLACAKSDTSDPDAVSLKREVGKLKSELDWYADPTTYTPTEGIWTDAEGRRVSGTYTPILQDGGERARKALGK